jgi:hypothetical protein
MHVNEPCECTLRIKQSPYWASEETAKDVSSFFVYEIEADYDNWLLSGKRKLKFASKVRLANHGRILTNNMLLMETSQLGWGSL